MELKIKKGLDLPIAGVVTDDAPKAVPVQRVAVVPDDFPGFVPKVDVREGDHKIVLVQELGGNLAVSDLAEEAV